MLHIIDYIFFIILAINVLYIAIFSFACLKEVLVVPTIHQPTKRFILLIAAYGEDKVIIETVNKCLDQNYPSSLYDVFVISDHMSPQTNNKLKSLPIKFLQVNFTNSTNTKSLKAALKYLGKDAPYDIALIIDADNIIGNTYLSELNNAFSQPGVDVIQTHRKAKNLNTNMAFLDGISEEMNNSIFRLGHANLGMSAALIGSGMAFNYTLFYDTMMSNSSVGGFDRVLEMKLLLQGIKFYYLPHTSILDEKVQESEHFYNQRSRWISAQYYSFVEFSKMVPFAIKNHKWEFIDKLYQQFALPRVLLLGLIFIYSVILSIIDLSCSYKWWMLLLILLFSLFIAVPSKFINKKFFKVLLLVPYSFLLMFLNLFRIKAANKKFIHTSHGE